MHFLKMGIKNSKLLELELKKLSLLQYKNSLFWTLIFSLINLIKNNNVAIIYTIYPVENSLLYKYLDKDCFTEIKISNMLNSYEIKNCKEINN